MAVTSVDGLDEQVLNELVAQGNLDFDDWITLITSYEHMYHDDIDKISLVYNSFLSEFPLCHGYWKKYAEHTARLCGVENVVPIFERAVEAVPYSVGVWVDYCSFGISSFEEPSDVRRLFERGLSFVGKDYLCHYLWDKYIEFEYSHEQWNSLACIYIYTLKFPTKKLHQYYESFKKLVAIWKEDLEFQGISQEEEQSEHDTDSDIVAEDAKISHFISDLIDPSTRAKALQKYISVGEFFYQRACNMDAKLNKFEQNIHRPYFHVKPLDDNQLRNWHQYLDLVEMEGDFDWAVKLYERCLIPCAHYPDFWMRYVDFVESKGGSEIASDALKRATHIFLKNVSDIHLFNAWCKEKVNDIDGAHASYLQCDQDFGSCFVDRIRKKANFDRRMGNNASASSIYKKAIEVAAEKRPDTLPMLYVHFARLQYMITDSVDATREVLLNGIQRVPQSKLLFEELILFALMHDGARQVDHLESVMAQALTLGTELSGGLSNKDQEDISKLYLEFIDTCGSIHDIRRAWKRHSKLFPHLVRVQPTHKKPAKAGDMWKMVVEGRPDSCSTDPQKSSKEFDKNHLAQMPPPGKVLVPENLDKSEQNGQSEFADDNSNQNDVKQGTLNVRKTFVKDDFKANESGAEVFHRASDDRNPEEAIKDSKSHAILGVQEQDQRSQQEKISSLEGRSLNSREDEYNNINASLSQGLEAPREASRYNGSTRAGGHNVDEIPSISSPASPRENVPAETCNDSPCPSSRMRHKDPSSTVSPDRPSDREGNRRQFNSSGKGRSRPNSPVASAERQERSLSPRRRNSHGNFDDRRHRERSLSPRRRNSRWNSEERWHRDRRNRRFSRYQDNARGQRDVRMQNQNVGVIGSTGQTQTAQQQSILGYPQAPTNQYPLPINEQYGTVQNNQLYNMWQYYYYNQQQQQQFLPQQLPSGSQQQLQQMQPSQQLQQQVQNSVSQQHMQTPQQLQQTPPNQQQLLHLPHQQQQLYQQLQFQQQLTNEQPECQQQQLQAQQQFSQQQLVLQPQQQQQVPIQQQQLTKLQQQQQQQVPLQQQQQTQLQQQDEVYLQQQQQQSYQYQQQQYLLYLQQLHQYQQSQQQSGIALDQKSFQQQQSLAEDQQKELPELEQGNVKSEFQQDDVSTQVDSVSCSQQRQEIEDIHGLTSQALTQDELPEIEGTDI